MSKQKVVKVPDKKILVPLGYSFEQIDDDMFALVVPPRETYALAMILCFLFGLVGALVITFLMNGMK